ncbi:hypothetical protein PFISCL1PPCAC_28740, partial [Pristionchus fissidentatus]
PRPARHASSTRTGLMRSSHPYPSRLPFFSRAMGPSSFSVLCESDEISRATTASASVTTSATRASQATILGMPALPDDVIIIIASSSISFSVSTTDVI